MSWYIYVAHFFAGFFLANGVPHFVNGVSGRKFQSPFASPPAVGESSAIVNTLWGFANFVIAYILLAGVVPFAAGLSLDSLVVGAGALAAAWICSWHFGRVRSKHA